MAAYVEFFQGSGARVVPLILGDDWSVNLEKVNKLDGVFFPGGEGGYMGLARPIYEELKSLNDVGHFYPLWGTCAGFQTMAMLAADEGTSVISPLAAHNINLPLDFIGSPTSSKMFGDLGFKAEGFHDYAVALNSHSYGLSPDKFKTDAGLAEIYFPTSVSYTPDAANLPFVASMESEKYPFYGTQFHPEKALDVYYPPSNINHSWVSVELNRYLSDKFITLARQNPNSYGTYSEVQAAIIQNYDTIVTDYWSGQVYVFE
jgi:gamma-glutamyl hydrolase